ncbi:MAG: hypothetical protein ACE5JX_02825 [Acidobacteriota bacterium]
MHSQGFQRGITLVRARGSSRTVRTTATSPGSGNFAASVCSRNLSGWVLVCSLSALGLFLSATQPAYSADVEKARWLGPGGLPLAFKTDQEVTDFLRSARVVSSKRIGEGVNHPLKVLLEKDGIRMHAVFRNVRISKFRARLARTTKYHFRDDALFEVAAYRLGQLLGLENIPPVVERTLYRKRGSLQLWIENALTEKKRRQKKLEPENRLLWQRQVQIMRVFDNLIYNEDRNQGNVLFDSGWSLWMIDHTRAFRRNPELLHPNTIWRCDRTLLDKLRRLNKPALKERIGKYLHPSELNGILKRRDLLIRHLQTLIQHRGESAVLFDLGSRASALS